MTGYRMKVKKSIIKIERYRLELWKHVCKDGASTPIIDPDDPINKFVREYSNGLNAGLLQALTWFEKYVEGKR